MNDHGLPLAMYPRREICVTLEVATGVGGGIGTREDGREESDHEPVERGDCFGGAGNREDKSRWKPFSAFVVKELVGCDIYGSRRMYVWRGRLGGFVWWRWLQRLRRIGNLEG